MIPQISCLYRESGFVYDLRQLSTRIPWFYPAMEEEVNSRPGESDQKVSSSSYFFNPCGKDVVADLPLECDSLGKSAPVYRKTGPTCESIGTYDSVQWVLDSRNPRRGVEVIFEDDSPCKDTSALGRKVSFHFGCSNDAHDEFQGPQRVKRDGCSTHVIWNTKHACPRNARTDFVLFLFLIIAVPILGYLLVGFGFNVIVRKRPCALESFPCSNILRKLLFKSWRRRGSDKDFSMFNAKHPMVSA